jgi:hypothetical protein
MHKLKRGYDSIKQIKLFFLRYFNDTKTIYNFFFAKSISKKTKLSSTLILISRKKT